MVLDISVANGILAVFISSTCVSAATLISAVYVTPIISVARTGKAIVS